MHLQWHVATGVTTDDAADPLDNAGGAIATSGAFDVRSGAIMNRGGVPLPLGRAPRVIACRGIAVRRDMSVTGRCRKTGRRSNKPGDC
jgi:hypothetical protein